MSCFSLLLHPSRGGQNLCTGMIQHWVLKLDYVTVDTFSFSNLSDNKTLAGTKITCCGGESSSHKSAEKGGKSSFVGKELNNISVFLW